MQLKKLFIAILGATVIGCTNQYDSTVQEGSSITNNDGQNTATIVRDNYGIPHIYADDKYGLYYGYGYALGQDRLFQLEMAKRGAEGRAAEVLGEEYIEADKQVRLELDPAAVKQQIQALNAELREPFEAYAAGINAWIEAVNDQPEKHLPLEYSHFGFKPSKWTAYDVFMLYIGNVAQVFCNYNEELNNLAFLQQLIEQHGHEKGWAIFDATMPLYDAASPVTAPSETETEAGDISTPPPYLNKLASNVQPPVRLAVNNDGKPLNIPDVAERRDYLSKNLALSGVAGNSGFRTTSNIWLTNSAKVKGADAVLVSGPQLGWGTPAYVHTVGLHGAGFDVVGKAFMFPFFISAYTPDFAWGTTYGASDQTDIFQLQLNPDNSEEYLYKGSYQPFEKRVETIGVKGAGPVSMTVYSSVYGVVVAKDLDKGVAYSKQRSWEGHEVMTAATWIDLPKAKDFASFRKQIEPMSTTINFYYMDTTGNIGYTLSGKYPQRQPNHDNRLPVPGDGSMDWLGMQPFENNPRAFNPEQGYISNWNNRPARNWPSSDNWGGNWAKADRVSAINERIESLGRLTPQQLWDINAEASYADINVNYLLPYLKQAIQSGEQSESLSGIVELLENWDRLWVDNNQDGYYDSAAPAIMNVWLKDLVERVLKDDVGDEFFYRFASPGYPTERLRGSWNAGVGIKIIARNLDELNGGGKFFDFFNGEPSDQVLRDSFKAAHSALIETYGEAVSNWKVAVPSLKFSSYNYQGVPQSLPNNTVGLKQMMNRGAENNFYVVSDNSIVGRDAISGGQSGFIAPDGSKSKHYTDQLDIYRLFETKELPLTKEQVNKSATQTIQISYER